MVEFITIPHLDDPSHMVLKKFQVRTSPELPYPEVFRIEEIKTDNLLHHWWLGLTGKRIQKHEPDEQEYIAVLLKFYSVHIEGRNILDVLYLVSECAKLKYGQE